MALRRRGSDMNTGRTLRVTAAVSNLPAVRDFVHAGAVACGLGLEAVDGMVLAVDEAVTNVIVHGYAGRDGAIDIDIERRGESVVVRVRDAAPPFDPTQAPAPDLDAPLEERAPGGLGIYLMRRSVDEVVHRVLREGGNELALVKYIGS